jgi:hypothetical protein
MPITTYTIQGVEYPEFNMEKVDEDLLKNIKKNEDKLDKLAWLK